MTRAHTILTDSGGLQEEGPALGKPVLVMRDVTERPEAVAAGTARLVGTSRDPIVGGVRTLIHDDVAHAAMASAKSPYGDGHASTRIVAAIAHSFGDGSPQVDFRAGETTEVPERRAATSN